MVEIVQWIALPESSWKGVFRQVCLVEVLWISTEQIGHRQVCFRPSVVSSGVDQGRIPFRISDQVAAPQIPMHQDSWTTWKEIGQSGKQGITAFSILTGEISLVSSPLNLRNQPPLAVKVETILQPAIMLDTGAKVIIMGKTKLVVRLLMKAG